MGENTKIEWADHTFNPWIGCQKVSEGCKFCYAEADFDTRRGYAKWGPSGTRVKTGESNWQRPLTWNRNHIKNCEAIDKLHTGMHYTSGNPYPPRPRVFCSSLADVFEDWSGSITDHRKNEVRICHGCGNFTTDALGDCSCGAAVSDQIPRKATLDDLRRRLFDLIDVTPHLDWLLVTKRPENILKMWPDTGVPITEKDPAVRNIHGFHKNVWIITSVEDQEQADKRIPELLKCRELSPVLGLSCEPLLGEVDFKFWNPADPQSEGQWMASMEGVGVTNRNRPVDWVIAGGESGPNARPMQMDWIRSIREQCLSVDVPFLFKQWGEWWPECQGCADFAERELTVEKQRLDCKWYAKMGKKKSGRILDSVEWNQYPEVKP